MTAAFIAALLLFLLSVKLFLWFAERLVTRQQNYAASREKASGCAPADDATNDPRRYDRGRNVVTCKDTSYQPGKKWDEPPALDLFKK